MKAKLKRKEEAVCQVHDWGSLFWFASQELMGVQGLTLGRTLIHAGACNPRHCHTVCEEVLYVLSGQIAHSVGDETVTLGPGDTLLIPRGVFHHAVNVGDTEADVIMAYSSGERDFILES